MKLTKLIALTTLISFFAACNDSKEVPEAKASNYELCEYLTPIEQIQNGIPNNTVLIDLRKASDYNTGHIEGALNVERSQIQDTSYSYGGMRATKSQLELLLQDLGANTGDTIIVYDDKGGVDASRLVWLLLYYGYEPTRLLDGGLQAALKAKLPFSKEKPSASKGSFEFTETLNSDILASKEDLIEALKDSTYILVDARNIDEYSGKRQKKGAYRAGHIPGAILIDFYHNINYESMKLKEVEELKAFYQSMGLDADKKIIVYCQSGVRSAQTTFVLKELLNYKNVKNYDGSWIEWSYFEELPIVTDSLTTILE